jgi:hypothetical protein
VEARNVVEWQEMVPLERGKESKISLKVETWKASVDSMYNMFAKEKLADEI